MQILEQRARKGTAKQIKMVVGRLAELGVAVPDEEIRLRAGDSRDRVVIRGFLPLKAFAIRVEFLFGRKFFEAEKEAVIGDSFQLFLESTQEDERKINWDQPYIILRQGGTAFSTITARAPIRPPRTKRSSREDSPSWRNSWPRTEDF